MRFREGLDIVVNKAFDWLDLASGVYVKNVPKLVRFVIHPFLVTAVIVACIPIYLIGMFVVGISDTWKQFD